MLGNKQPIATLAVRDLEAARRFYEGKLGLTPRSGQQEPATMTYACGGTSLFVYESANAGTNAATAVTWNAGDDVEAVARALGAKGVAFESYDIPDGSKDGDVYTLGEIKVAWFKDLDSNIHAIVNG